MYILIIATHFQIFLGFSKLYKQFSLKNIKNMVFYQKIKLNEKISDGFFYSLFFFSSPHVPEDK